MAECEVCGDNIRGQPILVQIGGAKMWVCSKCAKLGTEVQRPAQRAAARKAAGKPGMKRAGVPPAQKRRPRDVLDFMGGDLAEDFSERIRDARMEKGLSQKDLALKIKEKEGLIKKIETGLVPEDSVRKKIEAVLEIKLIESTEDDIKTAGGGKMTTTLGDVMNLKKGKR